VGSVIGTKS